MAANKRTPTRTKSPLARIWPQSELRRMGPHVRKWLTTMLTQAEWITLGPRPAPKKGFVK